MTGGCVFCDIAGGRSRAAVAYDDGELLVFSDHRPIRPGHVQIVPHIHVETFDQMAPDLAAAVIWLGQRIARVSKRLYRVDRVGFVFSGNDEAHVHAHVLPLHLSTDITSARYIDGPPPAMRDAPLASNAQVDRTAAMLRVVLDAS